MTCIIFYEIVHKTLICFEDLMSVVVPFHADSPVLSYQDITLFSFLHLTFSYITYFYCKLFPSYCFFQIQKVIKVSILLGGYLLLLSIFHSLKILLEELFEYFV